MSILCLPARRTLAAPWRPRLRHKSCVRLVKCFKPCHHDLRVKQNLQNFSLFISLYETSTVYTNYLSVCVIDLSQWSRGLRRGSATARLLGLRVRIPPGTWISVMSVVLSGRGLCVGLITRPEESHRVWCVWMWSWSRDSEVAITRIRAEAP
jgi:hypothetical protein